MALWGVCDLLEINTLQMSDSLKSKNLTIYYLN
ncbi:hypothetical protein DET65_0437 [Sunxiuqinia elliptica]|uniref:Uncharacterized protein n=1 Tax=Sunxiuqinia elliptica TaxID=655355 RepID=A0A4R6GSW2_9BACT|nr:hypothetical protein DET52_109116 [Sunxiuqinia elliptica]TDO67069.1 hypothetical protein DET65_0437 [Sunxiuqinia elliptica]